MFIEPMVTDSALRQEGVDPPRRGGSDGGQRSGLLLSYAGHQQSTADAQYSGDSIFQP